MKKKMIVVALMLSLVFISGCSTKNPQQTDLPDKWEQADSVEAVSFQRVSNNKSPVHGTVYWAEESLEKVSREELEQIADRARALGFEVSVSA